MSSIQDLAADLEDEVQETTLNDVADAIQNRRIQETKDLVASDEDDEKAVDKFFYHYTGRRRKQTSDCAIMFQSPNYLLVRSEMYSGKKEKYDEDGDGTYHAGWIVGSDPDQDSGFFIHRLDHTKELEDPEYEWTKDEIRDRMGFSREWQGGDIEAGEWYRLQGDIRMKKSDYDTVEKLKREDIGLKVRDGRKDELLRKRKQTVASEYEDEIVGGDPVRIGRLNSSHFSPNLRVAETLPEETDDLKTKQDELGISEDEVRAIQEENDDWTQLTAGRRKEAVKTLILSGPQKRLQELYEEHVDENEIEQEAVRQIETEWDAEEGQTNLQRGNHVLIFSNAIDHGRNPGEKVVVRDTCKLFVVHDEHRNQEIELDRGVYLIDQLDRHDRR